MAYLDRHAGLDDTFASRIKTNASFVFPRHFINPDGR